MIEQPQPGAYIPDPPRALPPRLYLRRQRAMFFVGLILAAVAPLAILPISIMAAAGDGSPLNDLALNSRHATTVATVTGKKLVTSVDNGSQHPWRIEFRFERPDGGISSSSGFTYDQDFGQHIAPGDQIEIQYDPADPSRARPVGGYAAAMPLWAFLLVAGIFTLEGVIGAGLVAGALMLAGRDAKLLAYGVGVEAEVVEVRRRKSIHFGSKNPYDVYYRFRDPWGREIAGRDRTYCYAWAEALRPGQRIAIVFNPRNPRENVLWLHGRELERLGGTVSALR